MRRHWAPHVLYLLQLLLHGLLLELLQMQQGEILRAGKERRSRKRAKKRARIIARPCGHLSLGCERGTFGGLGECALEKRSRFAWSLHKRQSAFMSHSPTWLFCALGFGLGFRV